MKGEYNKFYYTNKVMGKTIQIDIEEMVKLKEQGMSDREIAELFEKQGKEISSTTVYVRLNKYYELQEKEKPMTKRKSRINITDEELVKLKEQGMTYNEIAEFFIKQGKKISVTTVYVKLKKYYELQGKENPFSKNSESKYITDEELVELKEQGMTDKEIVEFFTKQGKKISSWTVTYRLIEYYEAQGKEKPRGRNKTRLDITDEELVKLKEQGMTDKEIAVFFSKKGAKISKTTVKKRLDKYYSSQGKEKPKAKSKTKRNITDEELVELKEQGMTYNEIAEFFIKQGKKISVTTVYIRLNKYYELQGKEKPFSKNSASKYITDEELVELKEQKITDRGIAEFFTRQGKKISTAMVNYRLRKYYELQGKEKPKARQRKENVYFLKVEEEEKYDNPIKQMLMNGMTVNEMFPADKQTEERKKSRESLIKWETIAFYSEKMNGEWVHDYDFLILTRITSGYDKKRLKEYESRVKPYITEGKLKKGHINYIKDNCLEKNSDLTSYILKRLNLLYHMDDIKDYKLLRENFEKKIDKYLERLIAIEQNRVKGKGNKKESNEKER